MNPSSRKSLPGKFRPLLLAILILSSLFGYSQTYNPSLHVTTNDAISPSQATPVDSRTMFYDASNFLYRPYQNISEVRSYLNLSKYRVGNFIIVVDSGGVLQPNGSYVGGVNNFWIFRTGTTDGDLVELNLFGSSGSCSGCLLSSNNLSDVASIPTARSNLLINNVDNTSDATKWAATVTLTNKTISGLSNTFSNIPNSALTNNAIGLSFTSNPAADISVTTTPAQLGASLTANFPNGSATQRGPIIPADWQAFHLKLDTVHVSNDSIYNCTNGTCVLAGVIAGGGGGSGTVTNFTSSNLSPLFNTNVTTGTTTPNQTFTFINAPARAVFGDSSATPGAPVYFVPTSSTLNTWFGGPLQGALTVTNSGSSGAATLIGNTLNIPVYSTGSGGNPNSNIGSGFRWAVVFTNNIKTVFGGNIIIDSTANTNALTFTADTTAGGTKLLTQGAATRTYQPIGSYVTGGTGDVVFTGPGSVPATIQANAVTTSKINNGAVTLAKQAVNTVNSLQGFDGSGNPADVTFTTTGSGAPTLTGSTLNIPPGTLTYTQNALNNTLAYNPGNSVTFLIATATKAGLIDSAHYHYLDSLFLGQKTFTLNALQGLYAINSNTIGLGGNPFTLPDTIKTAGFAFSITGLPNKATALGTDSVMIEDAAGKIWKLPVPAGGGGGTPGGSNTQVQFNNSGSFGGSANLTWSGTVLSTTGLTATGVTTLSGVTYSGGGATFDVLVTDTTSGKIWRQPYYPFDTTGFAGGSTNVIFNGTKLLLNAGSGGVSTDVTTTINSGSSSTVPNGTNIILFNPASAIASYTLTLPTTWHNSNDVKIYFGSGTLTSGMTVVTTLTIVNGSGQTLFQSSAPTTGIAGQAIVYHLVNSTMDQRQ